MRILPVLDLLNGCVVRGIGGRRSEYAPIVSQLTRSCDPIVMANAIRDTFHLNTFYIADLGGILRSQPDLCLFRRLITEGFELLIDAGIRKPEDTSSILETGVTTIVVGLETCRSPADLERIVADVPHVTFSLDLQRGIPRRSADAHGWRDQPEEIIGQVVRSNVESIIVLDLSDVGMRTGGSTDAVCGFVKRKFPSTHLITGGGVRNRADLARLNQIGVDEVLVASALHDGYFHRDDFVSPI